MAEHFEVFEDVSGHAWRWRLVAGNGEITATSEGYTRRWSAKRAARGVKPGLAVIYV